MNSFRYVSWIKEFYMRGIPKDPTVRCSELTGHVGSEFYDFKLRTTSEKLFKIHIQAEIGISAKPYDAACFASLFIFAFLFIFARYSSPGSSNLTPFLMT
jgi:hypothetical protein